MKKWYKDFGISNNFKGFMAMILLLLLGVICSGCAEKEGELRLLGVCQTNLSDVWQLALKEEISECCSRYDGLKGIYADAGSDPKKQIVDIDNMIEHQVDVIIVSVCEEGDVSPALRRAKEHGIPVIVIGYAPDDTEVYTSRIYVDDYKMGYLAGECAVKLLKGKGVVLEIQAEPYSTKSRSRKEGFLAAIKDCPGIIKEFVITGYWTYDNSAKAVEKSEIFNSGTKVDLVFAHNDEMAQGARKKIETLGYSPQIIGIGALPGENQGLNAVKRGELNATISYPTGGREAVEYSFQLINGEEIPKEIELEPKAIMEENYES